MLKTITVLHVGSCYIRRSVQCHMSFEVNIEMEERKEFDCLVCLNDIYTWDTTFGEYILSKLFNSLIHCLFVSLFTTGIHNVNIWLVLNQEESSTVIDRLTL